MRFSRSVLAGRARVVCGGALICAAVLSGAYLRSSEHAFADSAGDAAPADISKRFFGSSDCDAGPELPTPQLAPRSAALSEDDLILLFNRTSDLVPLIDAYGVRLPHDATKSTTADALKIVETGQTEMPYIGVYHHIDGPDLFRTSLAGTRDFVTWQPLGDLGRPASMPDVRIMSDGAVLYADERNPSGRRPFITVRRYAGLAQFITAPAEPVESVDLPRTRGATADGTPTFGRIDYGGNFASSRIEISHHYYAGGIHDQNARGTLFGFSTWQSAGPSQLNKAFADLGYRQVGGREWFSVGGGSYALVEARPDHKAGWDAWRIFLVNACSGRITALHPKLSGGATSLGNPRLSFVRLPDGRPGYVLSLYVFSEGAKATPAGSHLFVAPLPLTSLRAS